MDSQSYPIKISDGRRVVLPNEACQRLHVGVGDTVIVELVGDNEIRLRSWKDVLQGMQSYLAGRVPPGVSLADELIAERRAEAERD